MDALFRPHLETGVIRTVVSAIQEQQCLQLYYHAKAGGYENLSIAPNQLVYADGRYHVRAYCFEHNKFIDLVLSRMLEVELSHEDWVSSAEDQEWYTYVELRFRPNPTLPEALKNTLLLDFRLENGVYSVSVRKALQLYVVRNMTRPDWQHHLPLWLSLS
ncbi:MAG: WYL domain-containing protein [Thiolinea sp.]